MNISATQRIRITVRKATDTTDFVLTKAVLRGALFCALAMLLSACQKSESPAKSEQKEFDKTSLQEDSDVSKKLQTLEQRLIKLERSQSPYASASFDPANSKGYGRIDGNVGTFLVSLDNVEPYLNGQKITLRIGNPNNLRFSGFKLNVSWGQKFPDMDKIPTEKLKAAFEAYRNSRQEKEITFTESLVPGVWNKVQFNIAPAAPADFGQLGISITTDQVQMQQGR